MKIEELIQMHNAALNRKVEQNPFLNQRLKARLKDRGRVKHTVLGIPFKKSILVYSFLLILFTVLNFMLIDGLKKPNKQPMQPIVLSMNAFHPTYPGSISHAYAEVMK